MRIGIAFSGGLSKCAYQVGFAKALLRHVQREDIVAVSGASMGIFSAYALSADKVDVLEWIYKRIDIKSPLQLFGEVACKDLVGRAMGDFISSKDILQVPMCFPICYLPIFSTRYYWLYKEYNPIWKKYMKAALYFPGLHFMPMFQKGRMVLDGGAVDNIPIYPLLNLSRTFTGESALDLIIALHFDSRYDNRRCFVSETPILDIDVSISNDFKKNHLDFSKDYISEMLDCAEIYGDKICGFLFSGDCSKEALKKKINDIFLNEHEQRARNSSADSFDSLISVLNVVGRTFRRNSNCGTKLF